MSWELLVGVRYLRSRRRSFLSLISALSLAGVTIGVATLLIVLAVMTGLEYDLRQKILGFNPHVTLASFSGGQSATVSSTPPATTVGCRAAASCWWRTSVASSSIASISSRDQPPLGGSIGLPPKSAYT
jgi:hypothetical protein